MAEEAEIQELENGGVVIDGEAEELIDDQTVEPSESNPDGDESDDEVTVTIGDETPTPEDDESKAPEWVRELRKKNREQARKIKELEAAQEQRQGTEQIDPGPKPKLEDFDFDQDAFSQAILEWDEKKRQADTQANTAREQQQAAAEAWQGRLNTYGEEKSKLKVKDFDDAEEVVLNELDETQQGIIIQGADNSALVIYALGKNPTKAKELSAIKDPIKFAFAVSKLEKDLKVRNRKTPPPPEKTVHGTGSKTGTTDSTLERLREEAAKTGDYTKVTQYKKSKRAK